MAACAAEGLIGKVVLSGVFIQLAQQEVEAHALCALLPLHGLGQIGNGLGVALALYVVVGKCQIGERAQALALDFVDVHMGQHIVGLGGPAHGAIAQGLPQLSLGHEVGLPCEVAHYVVECGGRTGEVALHVLRLGHCEPGVMDKRVILVALEPLLVFFVVALAAFALGLLFDRVQRYGLLHLLDCAIEAGGGLRRLGVAVGLGRMYEQLLRIVVLVVILEFADLLLVVRDAIVIHVVARVESLPEARSGSVFAGAARLHHCHGGNHEQCQRHVSV